MAEWAKFESEIVESGRSIGAHVYKIPSARWRKMPYDIFSLHMGKFVAIECKVCCSRPNFSFDEVKPHQIEGLKEAKASGGGAFVLIKIGAYRKRKKVYAVDVDAFFTAKVEYNNNVKAPRKSITQEGLQTVGVEIVKGKDGHWDLSPLFI